VQRVEQGFCLLLADGSSLIGVEILDLTLDRVDLGELLQRELGDLALVGRVQIKELAACVGQAAHLRQALRQALFVAHVVVTDEAALPVSQEVSCVFARAGLAEVVDHRARGLERTRGVGPEVGDLAPVSCSS
jgi:hypothetical protein